MELSAMSSSSFLLHSRIRRVAPKSSQGKQADKQADNVLEQVTIHLRRGMRPLITPTAIRKVHSVQKRCVRFHQPFTLASHASALAIAHRNCQRTSFHNMAPKQATLGYVKEQQTLGCVREHRNGNHQELMPLQQVLRQPRRSQGHTSASQIVVLIEI